MWLVSADNNGKGPYVAPAGETVEEWDAYGQPTGIHYNPCDDYIATWAEGREHVCEHYNKSYQSANWLDFQWAQTGHDSKHLTHKVQRMYNNKPTKAVANGEPTYEGMGGGKFGLGWWQGHEAWMQLMHGGTMGHVYGAASLWQWKLFPDEPGWGEWSSAPVSWKDALHFEGGKYVGYLSKAFKNMDFADMEKHPGICNHDMLLAKPGVFYITYLPEKNDIEIKELPVGMPYKWFDPKTGNVKDRGLVKAASMNFETPGPGPWVLIIGEEMD